MLISVIHVWLNLQILLMWSIFQSKTTLITPKYNNKCVTGALYTDFVVYLPKESVIVRVKRDDCFANSSIPQLKQFFYDFIVPEMFTKTIYNKRVCQDTLDSIINKVVQVAVQEKVQDELNQLTILSLPPVTTSTVSGVKRKSSVTGPQLKKK